MNKRTVYYEQAMVMRLQVPCGEVRWKVVEIDGKIHTRMYHAGDKETVLRAKTSPERTCKMEALKMQA